MPPITVIGGAKKRANCSGYNKAKDFGQSSPKTICK